MLINLLYTLSLSKCGGNQLHLSQDQVLFGIMGYIGGPFLKAYRIKQANLAHSYQHLIYLGYSYIMLRFPCLLSSIIAFTVTGIVWLCCFSKWHNWCPLPSRPHVPQSEVKAGPGGVELGCPTEEIL